MLVPYRHKGAIFTPVVRRNSHNKGLRERDIRSKGIREKERYYVFGAYIERYLWFI